MTVGILGLWYYCNNQYLNCLFLYSECDCFCRNMRKNFFGEISLIMIWWSCLRCHLWVQQTIIKWVNFVDMLGDAKLLLGAEWSVSYEKGNSHLFTNWNPPDGWSRGGPAGICHTPWQHWRHDDFMHTKESTHLLFQFWTAYILPLHEHFIQIDIDIWIGC